MQFEVIITKPGSKGPTRLVVTAQELEQLGLNGILQDAQYGEVIIRTLT